MSPSDWIGIARVSACGGRLNGRHAEVLEHCDQPATVDLERRSARQLVDDKDAGRHLVRRQRGPAVFAERLAIGGRPWAQFDCGNRNLTQPLIRDGCDGGVCDRRVRTQCADDGLRGHLETSPHDHVVCAAVDVEEAIFIEMRQVARGDPVSGSAGLQGGDLQPAFLVDAEDRIVLADDSLTGQLRGELT